MEKENLFETVSNQGPQDPIREEIHSVVRDLQMAMGWLTTVRGACQWGTDAHPEDSSKLFPGLVYSLDTITSKIDDVHKRLDRTWLQMGKAAS